MRDAIWFTIDDASNQADELWVDLARRLPSPYNAAPLFLFGWSTWRRGNGTVAGMAARRAIHGDPTYTCARLLICTIVRGISPSDVKPLIDMKAPPDEAPAAKRQDSTSL